MSEPSRSPWLVLAVVCAGHALVLLDLSIVNIAVPSIVDGLHASFDQVLWIRNAYILVFAVLLVTSGRLGDHHGPRRLYVIGLVTFMAASAACGLAMDPNQLIAGRVVQAVGAALITPQTLVIVSSVFPAKRRGAAFGTWSAIAGFAALAGPVVGGVITTWLSWRWIFYVNVPLGLAVLVAIRPVVPALRPGRTAGRVEPVGVGLVTAGFLALMLALIDGERFDWGTVTRVAGVPVTIPALIVAGILLVAAFAAWDRFQRFPLVPLALFGERDYAVMIGVGILFFFSQLGISLPLVLYLQSALGYTPLQASLVLLPMLVVTVLVPLVAGRLTDRLGGRYVTTLGLILYGAGLAYLAVVASAGTTWPALMPGLLASGAGIACTIAPIAAVAMHHVKAEMAGAAAGLLNTTQQIGGLLGGAVLGAVLQAGLASGLRDEAARASAQLPPEQRQHFMAAFAGAVRAGLDVGRDATGTPAGLPPAQAGLAHDVFAAAYAGAFRASLLLCAILVIAAGLACAAFLRPRLREERPGEPVAAGTGPAAEGGDG
jgi:EmrB/QacA subfamily drug resistance transporter